jgi:hypothetical protein
MGKAKSTLRVAAVLVLCLSASMLWTGCDEIVNQILEGYDLPIPPPPLTEENILGGPMEGYQYLQIDLSSVLNGVSTEDIMFVQQWVYDNEGGSVYFTNPMLSYPEVWDWWHGVVIDSNDISENVLIEMLMPDIRFAVVEFAPHPYEFDDEIRIELSYAYSNIIELGISPRNLEVMCWDEIQGEYQIVPSQLDEENQKIIGRTDHFSRYIIATRGGF